jgi:uncharacterized integral membrane protein
VTDEEGAMSRQTVEDSRPQEWTWTGRLVAAAVVLGLLALFIVLNSEKVEIDMLLASTDIRLGWALLLAGALGFLAGLLFPRLRR